MRTRRERGGRVQDGDREATSSSRRPTRSASASRSTTRSSSTRSSPKSHVGVRPREAGLRRRDRRARHARRGVVQGLDAHHAWARACARLCNFTPLAGAMSLPRISVHQQLEEATAEAAAESLGGARRPGGRLAGRLRRPPGGRRVPGRQTATARSIASICKKRANTDAVGAGAPGLRGRAAADGAPGDCNGGDGGRVCVH